MKILILSNNCLSKTSSNGRTMYTMLKNFKNEDIYNFFIRGNLDNLDICNFYKITEMKLLKSPFLGQYINKINKLEDIPKDINKTYKHREFSINRLIRIIIWKNKRFKKQCLNIAKNIKPDAIIIQCGDNGFLIDLAIYLAEKLHIPLFSYNSEDYIFKKWNCYKRKEHRSVLFRLVQASLIKSYNRLYVKGKSFIYLTDSLKNLYLNKYPGHEAHVIYNSSELLPFEKNNGNDILYLGNIGAGRSKSLIEVSKIINKYLNKKLIIYSNTTNPDLWSKLKEEPTIVLNNGVSYEKCNSLMKNCLALLHVENLDSFFVKDTANAFSTKIADSLSSGKPFIVLAPKTSFVYQYIKNNDCAFLFSNLDEMDTFFQNVASDLNILNSKRERQIEIASKNHSSKINSKLFFDIINKSV